ncbi:GTP cyclohydrolase II RibA [Acuticoccus sp. M5D2P5]|uniref:GTP cyclohydrolase II RibA n=1 Tax=Acuticoccus kalidii TaxID=2910977 RepID=UPI001F4181A0|nr:GTP cyclohydrolase II RibA [Acuticoccus kalidii]MCF3932074.1 GTP cyclohydrolase II RibA [Acuticoccus kalidii]
MDLKNTFEAAGLVLISVAPVEIHNRIWICIGFEEAGRPLGDHPHLAMIYGGRQWLQEPDLHKAVTKALSGRRDVLVRIHSECILGDAFGSSMCDCGDQMRLSMDEMAARHEGVFVYLRQEGRGIGLPNKLDCLALQYGFSDGKLGKRRYSSDEANLAMGFDVDARDFEAAGALLKALHIASVRLITGNPRKIADLEAAGVDVSSAVDLWSKEVSPRAAAEIREKVARGYIYDR